MRTIISEAMLAIDGSLAASILVKITMTTALALAGTRLARKGRAAVRHVILTAAFALLLALPIVSCLVPPLRIALPVAAETGAADSSLEAAADPAASSITIAMNSRAVAASTTSQAAKQGRLSFSALLFASWLAGVLMFLLPVAAGLWQTRSLRRLGLPWRRGQAEAGKLASEAGIHRHIAVLLHESVPGPMTCGVIHPTVMLPIDAESWPAEELNRAIVHELEHVRRADWISRALARALCAVYWFHPLVWMAWRQFVLDAERACDDAVLRQSEAATYADQLVALAQRLLTGSSPSLLAMANRHDLGKRIAALLDTRQRRGRAGSLRVGMICAASALLVAALAPLHIVAVAQTPANRTTPEAAPQRFEAASIKPCNPDDFTIPGQRRQEYMVTPGRVTISCLTLERIIFFAYAGIGNLDQPLLNSHPSSPDHVRGGPGWLRSDTFVIEATATGTPDRTVMMGPMLRNLLEERFHLKTHRDTEKAPMYSMTVAKGGLKIKALGADGCIAGDVLKDLTQDERMALTMKPDAKPPCGNFTSRGDGVNADWSLGGTTLAKFANQTLSGVLDRYVMDQTNVTGIFNIHLKFVLDDNIAAGVFGGRPSAAYSAENPPPSDIVKEPSIFTALEEQLGLKLEKTDGPREFLVIDSVDKPSGM